MFESKENKFQYFTDEWNTTTDNVVENAKAKEGEQDMNNINTITSTLEVPQYTYAKPCIVCGELVDISIYDGGSKICPSCQKAIKFVKEKFRAELEAFE